MVALRSLLIVNRLTVFSRSFLTSRSVGTRLTDRRPTQTKAMVKYILDVDTGVDDAQALMMILAQPEAEVLAITCAAGNIGLDQVCRNTLSVLHVMDRLEVPVHRGCPVPILGCDQEARHHHGTNGLGGYEYPDAPGLDVIQQEHACNAIVRLVNENPGEICLIATAPLTNVAMALRLDPEIGRKLGSVVIMGGNMETKGNDFLCAEFNFGVDPEAAYITLSNMHCPVTLVTFELCTGGMNLPWEWYENLLEVDTKRGRFNRAIDAHTTKRKKEVLKLEKFYSCDPAAVAVALDEELIKASKHVYCTVELSGQHSRGSLVIDRKGLLKKPPNARLVTGLDTEKLKKLFEKMVE